jgi:hypothetical protein
MISLVIKGGLHAAIAAAYERGIKLDTIAQPACGPETLAGVSSDKLPQIVAWFSETTELVMGFGYPAGTLLHYSIKE